MAFTFIVKNTAQAGKVPTAGQLQRGELAINLVDQKLYSKNTSDEIFEIGVAGETPSGGTDERPTGPSVGDLYYDIDLGDLLVWNGTEWVPVGQEAIALNDLTDVDTTSGLADGTVLGYDGSVWKPVNPASLAVDVDLGYTPDGDNAGLVTNTAGDDATIPVATDGVAGLFTGAEKQKLTGIEAGAQVNAQAGRALSYDTATDPDTLNADIATDSTLGVVSIGDGIDVTAEGAISVNVPPGTIISETAPDPAEAGQLWWADTDVDEGGGRLYIYTGDEWVDTSLPGAGSYLTADQADDLYLSSTVDDVAQGAITFQGQTTHEAGIIAPVNLALGAGDSTSPDAISSGRIVVRTANSLITPTTGLIDSQLTLTGTQSNLGSDTNPCCIRSEIATDESFDGAGSSFICAYQSRVKANGTGNALAGDYIHYYAPQKRSADPVITGALYGFRTEIQDSDATNAWGVYSSGTAPNYFAGNIDCDGLINGSFSLRMQTDDPAAYQTTYSTDEEGNRVEKQTYVGTSESLLDIIRELRAANTELEQSMKQVQADLAARVATLEQAVISSLS